MENERAYVLHTRQYRESSQLVDLFSRDFGRFRAVAKGSRGQRKAGGHQLQAFTPLLVSWRGKGGLKNLTALEAFGNSATLHGEKIYIGLYLNELIVRLLPEHVPHESVFDRYSELILQLATSTDSEPLLRRFELLLLEAMGYGFDMTTELIEGRPIVADEYYGFTPDQGFLRVESFLGQNRERLFLGAHLLAMAADDYHSIEVRRCAKRLLRSALQVQLGERPLLSRQLFRQACVSVAGTHTPKDEQGIKES